MDLELNDYTKWLESVMSPYTPMFVPGFTTTPEPKSFLAHKSVRCISL